MLYHITSGWLISNSKLSILSSLFGHHISKYVLLFSSFDHIACFWLHVIHFWSCFNHVTSCVRLHIVEGICILILYHITTFWLHIINFRSSLNHITSHVRLHIIKGICVLILDHDTTFWLFFKIQVLQVILLFWFWWKFDCCLCTVVSALAHHKIISFFDSFNIVFKLIGGFINSLKLRFWIIIFTFWAFWFIILCDCYRTG